MGEHSVAIPDADVVRVTPDMVAPVGAEWVEAPPDDGVHRYAASGFFVRPKIGDLIVAMQRHGLLVDETDA